MTRFDRASLWYVAETLSACVLFALVSYLVQPLLEAGKPAFEQSVIAFLSTLPMFLVVWAIVRYFFKVDERERFILAAAGAVTAMAGVIVAVFLAKLESVVSVDLNLFAAFLLAFWSLSSILIRWRC